MHSFRQQRNSRSKATPTAYPPHFIRPTTSNFPRKKTGVAAAGTAASGGGGGVLVLMVLLPILHLLSLAVLDALSKLPFLKVRRTA